MQFKIQLISLTALAHTFYTKTFTRSHDGGVGKKQKGQSHLNLFSLLTVRAIPALQLTLQNTIGAVLFPGRKHLGQVIKAARSLGGLAAWSSPNSAFILSSSVNSQTSHYRVFHGISLPAGSKCPSQQTWPWTSAPSSIHAREDMNRNSQVTPPKFTVNSGTLVPGTFGATVMVLGHGPRCWGRTWRSPSLFSQPHKPPFYYPKHHTKPN